MSFTAQEVIDQAKLVAHPVGFVQQVSPTQLMAHLSNVDHDTVEVTSQIAPWLLSESPGTLTVSLAMNRVGYDLDDAATYTTFKYIDSGDRVWEIYVVAESDFLNPSRHPSAMIVPGLGGSRLLLPADPDQNGWQGDYERGWWKSGDTIEYRYIPLPTRLTKLSDVLQGPDLSWPYVVQSAVTLILQMMGAPTEFVVASTQREQGYYRNFLMQLYKQARIRTPNKVNDTTFTTWSDPVLTR